ncbi:diacylglycerol kinase [Fervidicella metallireducens AeB]|uniref:Diacylglycerol kinase n=1 Tax=Fervidicella metallireducens AeB TaxID=1403537 RepID=A0A017RYH1_9CLOT|nr:diacylglycerol kinase family protein [Fervidicella metallireducens]EYE88980.1 diacylglycerol kinase [Fervidicella metallireducens AeB]
MGILFIINPVAGKGKAEKIVPIIQEICEKCNIDYKILHTTKPKEGTELAKWGTENGYERIISVGGDGTLNEVMNGVVGSQSAIGVIPGGSGNDFIKSINSEKDLERIILDNIYGEINHIDLGKCNGRYFINVASGGMDAEVLINTHRAKRIFSGSMAYLVGLINTIFTYRFKRVKVKIDDLLLEDELTLTAVANGRYYGGGMLPAPMADLRDGYFDICFIKKVSKTKMLRLFPKFIKGEHEKIKEVFFYKGKHVELSSDEEIAVNIDGELELSKRIEFEIIPKALSVITKIK